MAVKQEYTFDEYYQLVIIEIRLNGFLFIPDKDSAKGDWQAGYSYEDSAGRFIKSFNASEK